MHSKPVRLEAPNKRIDDCGNVFVEETEEVADSIDDDWLLLKLSSSVKEYLGIAMVIFSAVGTVRFFVQSERARRYQEWNMLGIFRNPTRKLLQKESCFDMEFQEVRDEEAVSASQIRKASFEDTFEKDTSSEDFKCSHQVRTCFSIDTSTLHAPHQHR